ncbi:leiomodin-3-like [Lethenteron reissneri]|uniref:leiomodin-3-like n=1 Tax=Lethenteron reissneri TaxID=7753 RepID=UPI002AB5E268|nr:leiomodin-3-like [Lethenteron reissneri]
MSRDQERDGSDHRNGDEDDDFDEDAILANLSPEQLQQLAEEVAANDEEQEEQEEEEEATGSTDDDDDGDGDNGKEFDEDEILSALSKDQLRELERDLDDIQPDVSLPVGMRQKDQTEKIATGSYSHHSLIDYMQKQKKLVDLERIPEPLVNGQNKNGDGKIDSRRPLAEDEEAVDAEKSSGRAAENGTAERAARAEGPPGHVAGKPRERSSESSDSGGEERERSAPVESFARGESRSAAGGESASTANGVGVPNGRGSVTPPQEGSSEPAGATAADNADNPTGEQKQGDGDGGGDDDAESFKPKEPLKLPGALANSLKDQLAAKFGALQKGPMGKGPLGKGPAAKGPGRLSGNPTIVDDALRGVQNNDPELTEVNLNNIENVPMETLVQFAEALKKNKHVKVFSIANTHSDDNVAYAIANMLRANRSIDKLNLESNFISGRGIVAIMRCLQFNEALLELRFHNQRHILGTQAEMEISRLLKANNTLLKMGYHFELPGPRMIVTNLLTRNLDRQRQQRLMEQRIQEEQQQIRRMLAAGLAEMGEEGKEGHYDEEEEGEEEEEGWTDGLAASPRHKVLRGSQSLPASPPAPRSPRPPGSPVPADGRKPRSVGRTQAESHRSSSASGEDAMGGGRRGGEGGGWNMQGVLSQEETGATGGPRLKKRPEGEKDSSSKAQSRFLLKREQHDFRHVLQPTRKRKVKQNPKPKENCIHEDLMSEIRTTNVAMLKMTPKSMEQLKEEYLK